MHARARARACARSLSLSHTHTQQREHPLLQRLPVLVIYIYHSYCTLYIYDRCFTSASAEATSTRHPCTVLDGYCSTVQGLLDWFEVDLGFTELLFIQVDWCVTGVFVLYSRVSLSSCPFVEILRCLPRAVRRLPKLVMHIWQILYLSYIYDRLLYLLCTYDRYCTCYICMTDTVLVIYVW